MEIITHKEISAKGGKAFWASKTPAERSKIWKERAKKRYSKSLSTSKLA